MENAEKRLGLRPKVDYKEGFEKTINWYSHKDLRRDSIEIGKLRTERREFIQDHKIRTLAPNSVQCTPSTIHKCALTDKSRIETMLLA